MLGSIVHATVQPRFDMFFEGWAGNVYQLNNWEGASGAVVFLADAAVGAFYDVHSRYPTAWLLGNQGFFLRGMPADLRAIVERMVFSYLRREVDGRVAPVTTAVFWSAGETLAAAVPWEEFMEEGGHILRTHLLDRAAALAEWAEGYGMTADEVAFAEHVFERKQGAKSAWLDLTEDEARWLEARAAKPGGMKQCRKSFAEIGILVPCMEHGMGRP
ncbi:MAG: hypothetical protein U0793_32700 [Gemmataceae bacterium]